MILLTCDFVEIIHLIFVKIELEELEKFCTKNETDDSDSAYVQDASTDNSR